MGEIDLRKCNHCGEWFMSSLEVMEKHQLRVCKKAPILTETNPDRLQQMYAYGIAAMSQDEMKRRQEGYASRMANSSCPTNWLAALGSDFAPSDALRGGRG